MNAEPNDIEYMCPICNFRFTESGITICPNCGAEFENFDQEGENLPWVNVYTTNTEIDAEMFKANLESTGIPVHIHSQIDWMNRVSYGDLAIAKIFVPSDRASEAYDIIRDIESHREGREDN